MSQENVEVVRRLTEAWNEGGWEGAVNQGLVHPDVEYHDDERWPEARSAFGTAALIRRFDEIMDVLGRNARVEVEELLDAGDESVVSILRFTGEARASGIHHDYRWGFVFDVGEGRIERIQAYLEPGMALEAAGLAE